MNIYFKRLLKLAKHLESNRGLDKFNFGIIYKKTSCGTKGCAIGELPFCFPRKWKFSGETIFPIVERKQLYHFEQHDIRGFFNLSIAEYDHLFLPEMQYSLYLDVKINRLGIKATPQAVAKNIREFVKYKNEN